MDVQVLSSFNLQKIGLVWERYEEGEIIRTIFYCWTIRGCEWEEVVPLQMSVLYVKYGYTKLK